MKTALQSFDLFACLQPFSRCKLDMDSLTIHRHSIGDNIVDTIKRWFEEEKEQDFRYLVKSLLERATTQACIVRGEDEHAASLMADSFRLGDEHAMCLRLLRELGISDLEMTKLFTTLSCSFEAATGKSSQAMTGHVAPLVALSKLAGLPSDSTGFRNFMGGEFTARCHFNLLALPSLDQTLQDQLRHSSSFLRRSSIDHPALKTELLSGIVSLFHFLKSRIQEP